MSARLTAVERAAGWSALWTATMSAPDGWRGLRVLAGPYDDDVWRMSVSFAGRRRETMVRPEWLRQRVRDMIRGVERDTGWTREMLTEAECPVAATLCGPALDTRCVVEACALPSPAAAAERGR